MFSTWIESERDLHLRISSIAIGDRKGAIRPTRTDLDKLECQRVIPVPLQQPLAYYTRLFNTLLTTSSRRQRRWWL